MKLDFMIAQKHLKNNHKLAIIDISGIIISSMKMFWSRRNIGPSLDGAFEYDRRKEALAPHLALPALQSSAVKLQFTDGRVESFDPEKHALRKPANPGLMPSSIEEEDPRDVALPREEEDPYPGDF